MPDPEVPAKARSRTYSAAYKVRIVDEYESLDTSGKGALLRLEGLYTSLISAWRQQRDQGAGAALARPAGRPVPVGNSVLASEVLSLRKGPVQQFLTVDVLQ
jgi:transposase-like protein